MSTHAIEFLLSFAVAVGLLIHRGDRPQDGYGLSRRGVLA